MAEDTKNIFFELFNNLFILACAATEWLTHGIVTFLVYVLFEKITRCNKHGFFPKVTMGYSVFERWNILDGVILSLSNGTAFFPPNLLCFLPRHQLGALST